MQSPNWVPFYDDGRIVMFGRADAPSLGPRLLQGEPARSRSPRVSKRRTRFRGPSDRPIRLVDRRRFFRIGRSAGRSREPNRRRRWLSARPRRPGCAGATSHPAGAGPLPARDPGGADRALRTAPTTGSRIRSLNEAYRYLMIQEAAMLAGIPITPENQNRIRSVLRASSTLMTGSSNA